MVVALFLWPTIESPAFPQARDFKASRTTPVGSDDLDFGSAYQHGEGEG
jgi:hypothetical protein